jgi:Domain of unknown function (DUF3841)
MERRPSARALRARGTGRDTVRVWVLQPSSVWEALQSNGVLYVEPRRIRPDRLGAYRWMREQMQRRLPAYQGHYPWWAWFRPKPDLRSPRSFPAGEPGTRCVRLGLALRNEDVLLFSDEAWLWMLNGCYIPVSEGDDAAWHAAVPNPTGSTSPQALPPGCRDRLVKSWERIFDLPLLARAGPFTPDAWIQAVFERLCLDDVTEV